MVNHLLADIYQAKGKVDSVAKYLQLTVATKDSLFSQQKALQIQSMTFAEEQRSQEQIQEQQQYRNRLILYGLIGALIIFLVVSVILYRNNQHKQEAYALLQMQKTETYSEIKSRGNTCQFKIHPGSTYPIRKNGFAG
jgi:two-component system NtrC family sensor kinase